MEKRLSLVESIPKDWRALLSKSAVEMLQGLDAFLGTEEGILPARENIFAALTATPFHSVKLVILGQDPYPTPGHAHGLAFSVTHGTRLPGSLKNLFQGLGEDVGTPTSSHGNLSSWAEQGVLLLNTVLTVRAHEAFSHRKKGWEEVTGEWISAVNQLQTPVVFLGMGKSSQALLDARVRAAHHLLLRVPHPSPLTRGAFLKAVREERPFTQANAFLAQNGLRPIDWELKPMTPSVKASNK